jgi:glycosyltransferase involved in cell wall biosynthesis
VRICHVSPHLPPDQAANALLPAQLGAWMAARGDQVTFVAHPPGQRGSKPLGQRPKEAAPAAGPRSGNPPTSDIAWIPRRAPAGSLKRFMRFDAWELAGRVGRALDRLAANADLLHLHSNGLIIEVAAAWAARHRRPYVLTLYGTEIWHYRRRLVIDPFTRAYRHAAAVTFYSERLRERAAEVGLDRSNLTVTYPPVSETFTPHEDDDRRALRAALGITEPLILLNVKRLHPLAGQRFLIEAFAGLVRGRSDVRLIICGAGDLRQTLEAQARALGIDRAITFSGLVDNAQIAKYMAAADVFVLPSLLEALPTVAVEALASGTPVISADHPGGVELARIFGDDIAVVPRENVEALQSALAGFLRAPRRTRPETAAKLTEHFRPPAVLSAFEAVYTRALAS